MKHSKSPWQRVPGFSDEDTEVVIYPGNPRLVEYRVPLESGVIAKIILPIDMTSKDVQRLSRYLDSLVVKAIIC